MKLTKATLKRIIKEELEEMEAVEEAEQYTVPNPRNSEPMRYSEDSYQMRDARKVIAMLKETYPKLMGAILGVIEEDHLEQEMALGVDDAGFGGHRNPERYIRDNFLRIAERAF